jgi:hypothetical protein
MEVSASNADVEIVPFDYIRDKLSFKDSSNLNLVTHGSENIDDETDV